MSNLQIPDIDPQARYKEKWGRHDPDVVHIMLSGRILESGGPEPAHELEEKGYNSIRKEFGIEIEAEEKEIAAI